MGTKLPVCFLKGNPEIWEAVLTPVRDELMMEKKIMMVKINCKKNYQMHPKLLKRLGNIL